MQDGGFELETKLIICSDDPPAVIRWIAGLTEIAGYRLSPRPSATIRDLHLDTPDGALRAAGLAFRLRTVRTGEGTPTPLVTLKGRSRRTEWGGVERSEFEAPWSEAALNRVLQDIRGGGIALRPDWRYNAADALGVFASLGLDVLQDRETLRQPRDVFLSQPGGVRVAELAIDAATYHFRGRDVRHFEVEIESQGDGAPAALKAMADELAALCAPALRPWPHGKLAIGRAIEALIGEGKLEGLLEADGRLKPAAYGLLGDALDGRRV